MYKIVRYTTIIHTPYIHIREGKNINVPGLLKMSVDMQQFP